MQQASSAKTLEQIRTSARRRLIGAIILVVLAIAILPWILESKPRGSQNSQTEVRVSTAPITPPPLPLPPVSPPSVEITSPTLPVLPGNDGGISAPPTTTGTDNPFFVVEGTTNSPPPIEPGVTMPGSVLGEGSHAQQTSEGYAIRPSSRPIVSSKLRPGEVAPVSTAMSDAVRAAQLLGEPIPPAIRPVATTSATATASASQRFVIQVGAYSDIAKANEVRAKLTMAGFTSYTEVANTNTGKVTRVRVGPVNGRAKADEMAKKIEALGFAVSILPT
ncbi:MAG: SPOR domain-containing protein [Saezia sp.]